jgi:hypothetical protein
MSILMAFEWYYGQAIITGDTVSLMLW